MPPDATPWSSLAFPCPGRSCSRCARPGWRWPCPWLRGARGPWMPGAPPGACPGPWRPAGRPAPRPRPGARLPGRRPGQRAPDAPGGPRLARSRAVLDLAAAAGPASASPLITCLGQTLPAPAGRSGMDSPSSPRPGPSWRPAGHLVIQVVNDGGLPSRAGPASTLPASSRPQPGWSGAGSWPQNTRARFETAFRARDRASPFAAPCPHLPDDAGSGPRTCCGPPDWRRARPSPTSRAGPLSLPLRAGS